MGVIGIPGAGRGARLAVCLEPTRIENQLDSAATVGIIAVHYHAANRFGNGCLAYVGHVDGVGNAAY